MKEEYSKPVMELIDFSAEDIITTSSACVGRDCPTNCGMICTNKCRDVCQSVSQ